MDRFLMPRDFIASREALTGPWRLDRALAYTRWLATHHYENFHLVSLLLPKRLHQDFYNVYAFCRWADDLGDELGDPAESLRQLAWWRRQLDDLFQGAASHPVFLALAGTVARHHLPRQPFDDLITAFERDQTVTRYPTWDAVLDYCRYSANPVGRLVLALGGYQDEGRLRLSDATCTALQLANFWQDITVDLSKDRVYIPLEAMARHGYRLEDLFGRRLNPAFRALMRELVDRTRGLFLQGLPLSRLVGRRLALDIELFSRGGMRVLDKIEALDYNVLAARPTISRTERVWLLLVTLARLAFRQAA